MIIYGSSLSPFVRKAAAFATEKGIEFSLKGVGLGSTDPEFLEASPFKKMPAIRDGDYLLSDSTAIVAYLDAIKPDPSLIPADPKARGKAFWWDEFSDTILVSAAVKVFFNRVVSPRFLGKDGDLEAADHALATELPPIFDYIERSIPASGWLVEDRLTLADIAVASPFANLKYADVTIDSATRPNLAAFLDEMFARPSFAALLAKDAKIFGG